MEGVLLWEALLGLGLGLAFGLVGRWRRLLSTSGAVAVAAVSLVTFAAGGWEWGAVLCVHLISAGAWSRFRRGVKASLAHRHALTPLRSAPQVLARTGWAALLAILRLAGSSSTLVYAAYVGAIATAVADTWSTQVGMLSPDPPRLITTRARAEAGTPGAISPLGLVAALGGTWLAGLAGLGARALSAWLSMRVYDRRLLWLPLAAMVAGLAGSLVDSLLGATAQAVYYCEACQRTTEDPLHTCPGKEGPVRRMRGVPWLTDQVVDVVSSLAGATLAAFLVDALAGLVPQW